VPISSGAPSGTPDTDVTPGGSPMAPIEQTGQSAQVEDAPVVEETLVEEVSIDGMCGVY
jgi:mycofactocin precursor